MAELGIQLIGIDHNRNEQDATNRSTICPVHSSLLPIIPSSLAKIKNIYCLFTGSCNLKAK
jgi:hypothetical protein